MAQPLQGPLQMSADSVRVRLLKLKISTVGCGMNITQIKTLDQEVTVFSQLSV